MMRFTYHLFLIAVITALSVSRTHAQQQSAAEQDSVARDSTSAILQQNTENWFVDVPGGGRIWASENPSLTDEVLNISTTQTAAIRNNQLTKEVQFYGYTNYASFIDQAEILVYRGSDKSLSQPLAKIPITPGISMRTKWKGKLPASANLRQGKSLLYILRVHGQNGSIDETYPRRISLITPQELERQRSANSTENTGNLNSSGKDQNNTLNTSDKEQVESVYGRSNLRIQNIPIHGSAVKIQGQNIPSDVDQVTINGRSVPVDQDNKFVAKYLKPVGKHQFNIQLQSQDFDVNRSLTLDITGRYFFMVGIADLTVSKNGLSENVKSLNGTEDFKQDLLVDGRLALYLKAKIKGKYLITAQTDTREDELKHMFDGYFKKSPEDLFRRLDPDRYYPVYGDDGTVRRDVNSQGKLYVRMSWDKNEVTWGNYSTDFTDNEVTSYQRGLYGAKIDYRSNSTTEWGESTYQLKAFGSQAQTSYGHNEFVATGGSVYYLKHTDVLAGSEKIQVELRNTTTGRIKNKVALRPGVDYEFDHYQGRLILRKPISQIVSDKKLGVIRNGTTANLQNVLLIDYEYIPGGGFNTDNLTAGARGKAWLGGHVGIGGTIVNEERQSNADYNLAGGDLTLQASRGTFLKAEVGRSKQTQTPIFVSYNGGLSFSDTTPTGAGRDGESYSLKGSLDFQEVAGSENQDSYFNQYKWNVNSWWKERDSGFSVSRNDFGYDIKEYGAKINAQVNDRLNMQGRFSKQELTPPASGSVGAPLPGSTGNSLQQGQVVGNYQIDNQQQVTAEVRTVEETNYQSNGQAVLGGAGYQINFKNGLELYGQGQTEVTADDSYEDNKRLTAGTNFQISRRTSLGGEYSYGSRGDAFSLNASHNVTQDYELYGRYGWSPDFSSNSIYDRSRLNGFTVGQKWRATDRLNVFQETQQVRSGSNAGLGHSLGLNFVPSRPWRLGARFEGARIQAPNGGIKRRAATFTVGQRADKTKWNSKLEYRGDFGAEERTQLVTTQRFNHRISESWRLAARLNYSDTDAKSGRLGDARFFESNLGVALRPWNSTQWSLLTKFSYLYDRQSLGQVSNNPQTLRLSSFDQQSVITSLEGIYEPIPQIDITAKGAIRLGEIRNRSSQKDAPWFKSTAQFLALQLRYNIWKKWDAMAEGRLRRNLQNEDSRMGTLIAIDRRITDFLHFGVGYNFSKFSDDLSDLDYNDQGWFINIVGTY